MYERRRISGLLSQCRYADFFSNVRANIRLRLVGPGKILPFNYLAVDNVFADILEERSDFIGLANGI